MSAADVIIGRLGNPNHLEFRGPDTTYAWFFSAQQYGNASVPHNSTFNIGWNVNIDGNPEIEGEPVWRDSWEANYLTGSNRYMERHWQYIGADGTTTRRPLSANVNRSDHAAALQMSGSLTILDSTSATQRVFIGDQPNAAVTNQVSWLGCIHTVVPVSGESRAFIIQNVAGDLGIDAVGRDSSDYVLVGGVNGAGVKIRYSTTVRIQTNSTGMGFFNAAPVAQPADIVALTDNIAGALNRTLAAIPDPADTPLLADNLRDDLVNNVLPKIRDALSSLADAVNDLRTQQRSLGLMA